MRLNSIHNISLCIHVRAFKGNKLRHAKHISHPYKQQGTISGGVCFFLVTKGKMINYPRSTIKYPTELRNSGFELVTIIRRVSEPSSNLPYAEDIEATLAQKTYSCGTDLA